MDRCAGLLPRHSGKDPQSRIITLAGYAAREEEWRAFEEEVEPVFTEYGVRVLHTKDLHNTDGEFRQWPVLRKQAFVAKLCRVMSRHALLGMSMSALKEVYKQRAAESDRKRTVTAYTFCSNVLIDWVMRDIRVGRVSDVEGVAFVLELGNEHNAEAEWNFYEARRQHNLENVLRSISFVAKESCRAIQMADLFAFYSRRHGAQMEMAPIEDRARVQRTLGTMLSIITESVPHRAFVATDFGPDLPASRFFAGDP